MAAMIRGTRATARSADPGLSTRLVSGKSVCLHRVAHTLLLQVINSTILVPRKDIVITIDISLGLTDEWFILPMLKHRRM